VSADGTCNNESTYCSDKSLSKIVRPADHKDVSEQWRTQEFCSGGGVSQFNIKTEGKKNGDVMKVAP